MNLLTVWDRPIAFHRPLVDIVGSITGALLLSQAIYWQRRCKSEDGWFWKTQKDWEEETGMTRREFDSARKSCAGILLEERRGVPAKLHFKIDEDALQTRLAESAKLDEAKAPNSSGGKRQTTIRESTSETTSVPLPVGGEVKPDAEADRKKQHTDFIDKWTKSYKANFGRDYIFNGGRDGKAVKDMLTVSKMDAEKLADLAWRAWKCRGREFFHCGKAVTIAYFSSHLNEIMAELKVEHDTPRDSVEDNHEAKHGVPRGTIALSQRPFPGQDEHGNEIGVEEWEKRFPLTLYDHER